MKKIMLLVSSFLIVIVFVGRAEASSCVPYYRYTSIGIQKNGDILLPNGDVVSRGRITSNVVHPVCYRYSTVSPSVLNSLNTKGLDPNLVAILKEFN